MTPELLQEQLDRLYQDKARIKEEEKELEFYQLFNFPKKRIEK